MSDINHDGPAFPTGDHPESPLYANAGMTLRDYFAAKAMAALIVSEDVQQCDIDGYLKELAFGAYKCADAMLKARGDA